MPFYALDEAASHSRAPAVPGSAAVSRSTATERMRYALYSYAIWYLLKTRIASGMQKTRRHA